MSRQSRNSEAKANAKALEAPSEETSPELAAGPEVAETETEQPTEAPEETKQDRICGMEPEEYFAHVRLMTQHARSSNLAELGRLHPEVAALLKERDDLRAQLEKITAG